MTSLGNGEMTARDVDGVSVLICRIEDRFYAVSNRCSHASQSLVTGRLRGTEITCPLHGARFDVRTGACLAPPADKPLKTFPVTIESGRVCVTVAVADRPARPRFGPLN